VKKIAFGIVLLLLVGAVGAPKSIGDRAHQQYLKSFNEYPIGKSGVSFEQRSYEQSWFSSEAVTVMRIPVGLPDLKDINVVMTSHIGHGPIVSTVDGISMGLAYVKSDVTLEGLSESAQKLVDRYFPAGTITTTSLIDFGQLSNDAMQVSRIDFGDDKVKAVFGGMNLSGVTKLDYSLMQGKFGLMASSLDAGSLAVDIADASGSYDMHRYHDMFLGKVEVNFPQIKARFPQGAVVLEEFKLASNSEEQAGKLNMSANVGVNKVNAPIPITAFQYDIEAKQIDMKAVELWGEIAQEMQGQRPGAATVMNDKKIGQLFDLLLQKDSELGLKFTLDGMGGRLSIDSNIRAVGLPEGVHVEGLADKNALLKATDMHMTVNVDEKVLMATPLAGMVAPYIQSGMVVKNGDKLTADIKLALGELTVNGIPTPMPGAR
jgi:uncharacterized protein YdgA (DUF945 family)